MSSEVHQYIIEDTFDKSENFSAQLLKLPIKKKFLKLKTTNLDNLVFGDEVNLEIDQSTIVIVDTTERILKNKT